MRWIWIVAWTYLVFVLHTGVAHDLAVGGCAPHLLLAGLMLLVVRTSIREGVVLGALWGLLSDCLAGERLGPDVIAFTLAAFVFCRLESRSNQQVAWRTGALSIPIVWGALLVSTSLRMLADGHIPSAATLAARAAGQAIYTGLLVAVASLAVRIIRGAPAASEVGAAPVVSNQWRRLTG